MNHLDPLRVESTLIILVDDEGEDSALVQVARSRNFKAMDFYTGGRFNPLGIVRLSKWVRRHDIDILHAHGYKSDIYSLLATRHSDAKVISTPHGWSKETRDRKLMFYESLDRFCFRYLDRVCPLSPDLWEDINRRCAVGARNVYIPNGVDLDDVDRVVAAPHSIDGSVTVGYSGQLIERKNIHVLLEAFRDASCRREELRLMIVGEGPLQNTLLATAEKMGIGGRTTFTGFRDDAMAVMKTFDLFVLPSLLEGIPRCVMESMALGIPVLVSDIPGNRELVEHGRTGLLFPANDARALADAIVWCLDHPSEVQGMRTQARRRIETNFSAKRMAEDYMAVYLDVLGRRPKRRVVAP